MLYVTYDGPDYTSIHKCSCIEIGKRLRNSDRNRECLPSSYRMFLSFQAADDYANHRALGKPSKGCSKCGTDNVPSSFKTREEESLRDVETLGF